MPAAPRFWSEPAGPVAGLLQPLAAGWDAAGRLRRALTRPYRAPVPVVCVGNLVAGGAGKTPVVLSLAAHLAREGVAVHGVTRGHGGRLTGPLLVDPVRHDAAAVGDEALLVAAVAPCWVARDRAAGTRAAIAAGAEAILLDDGFQNPNLAKSLSLIVVDAAYGFGNGRVIPAGPLRESLARGLARADVVILLSSAGEAAHAAPGGLAPDRPILHARLEPSPGAEIAGERLYAFAGIGRPEKFFAMLRAQGAVLAGSRAFADHHRFRAGEIAALRREADRSGACLITTAKDIVRLPPEERTGISVYEVAVRWPDPAALAGLLRPVVLSAGEDGRHRSEDRR